MTDGSNNPNDLSDDDWAMSEPEIPVKKEAQAKPVDEKAASLYAPPDTGDLEDWDLTVKDVGQSAAAPPPPQQGFHEPTAFTPPQKAFEILKPIAPPRFNDEDWGMTTPKSKNDGWKMPDPIFRVTDGEILTKVRKSSPKSNNNAAPAAIQAARAEENLPGIYAPPDTEESIDTAAEDFSAPDTQEVFSEEMNFSDLSPAESIAAQPAAQQAAAPKKSRKWLYIFLALFAAGAFILLILAGVFGFFFYNSRQ